MHSKDLGKGLVGAIKKQLGSMKEEKWNYPVRLP